MDRLNPNELALDCGFDDLPAAGARIGKRIITMSHVPLILLAIQASISIGMEFNSELQLIAKFNYRILYNIP